MGLTPPPERVVIFGASGFVGGVVAKHLKEAGDTPVVCYSSREFDLLDPAQAHAASQTLRAGDAVVWSSAITRRVEESWEALQKNAEMVRNLLRGIPPFGIRSLLAFSTVDVYGLPPKELPITESTATSPDGHYSLSMSLCETIFSIDRPRGVPLTLLRLPGVYGHGDGGISVVSRLADRIRQNAPVRLEGGGGDRRDFLWGGDLGPVVSRFISDPTETTVNVASGESVSIKELVEIIGDALSVSPTVEDAPTGSRSGSFEFDTTHLNRLIPDFKPTPIKAGIEKLVNS